MASERSEDLAVLRHLAAATLAGIGLTILLAVAPPLDANPATVSVTHEHVIDASAPQ